METFFSVIIPVWNTEKYIRICIDSLIKQNFDDYEIILINDGSVDDSGNICNEYKLKFDNISVIHQENKGASSARNLGIKAANGKYLIFLDSDDTICDGGLKLLKEELENQSLPDIMICRAQKYDITTDIIFDDDCYFDTDRYKRMKNYDIYEKLRDMKDMHWTPWGVVVKRLYITTNNLFFYEGIICEDEEWTPRVFFNAKSIGYNNNFLCCYKINRTGSVTSSRNIKGCFDRIKIADLLEKEFKKDKYNLNVINAIYQERCSIIFGTINFSVYYRNLTVYNDLINLLKTKIRILKYSKNIIHRASYIMCRILGIQITGIVLQGIVVMKSKFGKLKQGIK